jgi:xanthosine phosphorylase
MFGFKSLSSEHKAARIIKKLSNDFVPKVAIVLGSGLGKVAEKITDPVIIPYNKLPNFSVTDIPGHAHQLRLGKLYDIPVACLEGRTHFYEGKNAAEVIRTQIRTMKLIGSEILINTNAVGSLNPEIGAGNLVLVKNHINLIGNNPLVGCSDDEFGSRFIAIEGAYDLALREKILQCAKHLHINLTEGVYVGVLGPSFETAAEIKAFKMLGADIVGMSTIPEVIVARQCGLKVAVISAVSNLAAGLAKEELSHEVTLKGSKLAVEKLAELILELLKNLK